MINSTREDLPSGTVTFVFTDVAGSTKPCTSTAPYADLSALTAPVRAAPGTRESRWTRRILRSIPAASDAVTAANEICDGLVNGPIRVRIGIHTESCS
jgi:class 3 adenylate cyclase